MAIHCPLRFSALVDLKAYEGSSTLRLAAGQKRQSMGWERLAFSDAMHIFDGIGNIKVMKHRRGKCTVNLPGGRSTQEIRYFFANTSKCDENATIGYLGYYKGRESSRWYYAETNKLPFSLQGSPCDMQFVFKQDVRMMRVKGFARASCPYAGGGKLVEISPVPLLRSVQWL